MSSCCEEPAENYAREFSILKPGGIKYMIF